LIKIQFFEIPCILKTISDVIGSDEKNALLNECLCDYNTKVLKKCKVLINVRKKSWIFRIKRFMANLFKCFVNINFL